MATFFLIRHASNDTVNRGIIAGRSSGVHLNAEGRRQAERLAEGLARRRIRHIFSSPLERARETAEPLAKKLGLEVQISEALNEVHFGDWTGRPVTELKELEKWRQWNLFRSSVRIPNGELMLEIQARVVGEMERLHREFPEDVLALFSHGDPIRAALVYYLGMPLDLLLRVEVGLASATVLDMSDWGVLVRGVNLGFESKISQSAA